MNKTTSFFVLSIIASSIFLITLGSQSCFSNDEINPNKEYPIIKSIDTTFSFLDAKKAFIELYLQGLDGEELYCLTCDNFTHSSLYPDKRYSFSGDFDCYLKSLYKIDPVATLFTENQSPTSDWDSTRARFIARQLVGECGEYPDYGKIRTFNLREMQIILSMKDIIFTLDTVSTQENIIKEYYTLQSFTFQIIAIPDPNNKTSITETSKFIKPYGFDRPYLKDDSNGCSKVRITEDK